MRHAPCDLITVKLIGTQPIDKILLPTAGGPHAILASKYVAILKKAYNAEVTFCNVAGSNPTERQKDLAMGWIDETIAKNALQGSARKLVIEAGDGRQALRRGCQVHRQESIGLRNFTFNRLAVMHPRGNGVLQPALGPIFPAAWKISRCFRSWGTSEKY
jgi:hypothetical protein